MTDDAKQLEALAGAARDIADLVEVAATYRADHAPATAHERLARARAAAERLALDLLAAETAVAGEAGARARSLAA